MILPVLAIAAGAKALGALQEGRAGKAQAQRNAALNERDAAIARDQANAEMLRQNKEARRTIGSMRAAYGAAGVTIDGSALDVLEESAANAELDRLTIEYRGELRASGAEISADDNRQAGDDALKAGYTRAAGSILSAFGDKR